MRNVPSFRKHPLRRTLALLTCTVFLWTNVVWGAVSSETIWGERRAALRTAPGARGTNGSSAAPSTTTPTQWAQAAPAALSWESVRESLSSRPALPASPPQKFSSLPELSTEKWLQPLAPFQGLIKEIHLSKNPGAPRVLHFQDVHAHLGAQESLSELLGFLNSDYRMTVVGLEGASGPFRVQPYREFPDAAVRDKAAHQLLRDGMIGGPEFFAMTSAEEVPLWGVEDNGLYLDHIRAFRQMLPRDAAAKSLWGGLQAAVDALAQKVCSPAQVRLSDLSRRYVHGEMPLTDYVSELAGGRRLLPSAYPALALFQRASELEKTLDFSRVESERRRLLEALAEKLDERALAALVAQSLAYRMGSVSYGEFHRFLEELCRSRGVPWEGCPEFRRYLDYVLLADRIDGRKILPELEALETARWSDAAVLPDSFVLQRLQQDLRLVEKLFSQSLTSREWDQYAKRRAAGLASLPETLAGLGGRAPSGSGAFGEYLAGYERFYRLAEERNSVLLKQLLEKSEEAGRRLSAARASPAVAVLVTGGFHTDGLTRLMREKDVSYVVLSPKVDLGAEDFGSPHGLDFFKRTPTDLEKLFLGEKLFLNTPRLTAQAVPEEYKPLSAVAERYFASLAVALKFLEVSDADAQAAGRAMMQWTTEHFDSIDRLETWGDIEKVNGVLRVPLQINDRRVEVLLRARGAGERAFAALREGRPVVHQGETSTGERFEILAVSPPVWENAVEGASAALARGREALRSAGWTPSLHGVQSWEPTLRLLDMSQEAHRRVALDIVRSLRPGVRSPRLLEKLQALEEMLSQPEVFSAIPVAWWQDLAENGPLLLPYEELFERHEQVWRSLNFILTRMHPLLPGEAYEKTVQMAQRAGVAWNLKGLRFVEQSPDDALGAPADRPLRWTKDGYVLIHAEELAKWEAEGKDVFKSLFLTLLHENHEFTAYQNKLKSGEEPEADDFDAAHRDALLRGFHPDNPAPLSDILVSLPATARRPPLTHDFLQKLTEEVRLRWVEKDPAVLRAFLDLVANPLIDDAAFPILAEFVATPGFDRAVVRIREESRKKRPEASGVLGELYHAARLKAMGYEIVSLGFSVSENLDRRKTGLVEIDILARKDGVFYFVEAHHSLAGAAIGLGRGDFTALDKLAHLKLKKDKFGRYKAGVMELRRVLKRAAGPRDADRRFRQALKRNTDHFFGGNKELAQKFYDQVASDGPVPVVLTLTDSGGTAYSHEASNFENEWGKHLSVRGARLAGVSFPVLVRVFPFQSLNAAEGPAPALSGLREAFSDDQKHLGDAVSARGAPSDKTSARSVLESVFGEHPAVYERLMELTLTRFAPNLKTYQKLLRDDILPDVFLQLFRVRAKTLNLPGLAEYARYVKKTDAEKKWIADKLVLSAAKVQGNSEFFFRRAEWPLEESLPRLIESKIQNGQYRLRLKSFFSAGGEDPYSLALAVRQALEDYYVAHKDAIPETDVDDWLNKWDVRIDALETSFGGLYMTHLGRFDELDGAELPERFQRQFQTSYHKLEIGEEFRKWVVPQFVDFDDPAERAALNDGEADIVFLPRLPGALGDRPAVLEAAEGALAPRANGMFLFSTEETERELPLLALESDGRGGWRSSLRTKRAVGKLTDALRSAPLLRREQAALMLGVAATPASRAGMESARTGASPRLDAILDWALRRTPPTAAVFFEEEPPAPAGEGTRALAVMDERYHIRKKYDDLIEKRRQDMREAKKNLRKHQDALKRMMASPPAAPSSAEEKSAALESLRTQQFRVEGARLRVKNAINRYDAARRWREESAGSLSKTVSLFDRLAATPNAMQEMAIGLAEKYLQMPRDHIFFIDPQHPMAEASGLEWDINREGHALGIHVVMNDGQEAGRYLFINAAVGDYFTLVRTIVHESWHLKGFPKAPLNLPTGLMKMLEEGITELRTENTMSQILQDAQKSKDGTYQAFIESLDEEYRALLKATKEEAPAGVTWDDKLDLVLNRSPYLDYETLVMDMVEAMDRETLTRLFEEGNLPGLQQRLGDKLPALERMSPYLLLPPNSPLRLFAAYAMQEILQGRFNDSRLAGWEAVLRSLADVNTYVEWASVSEDGSSPWMEDESFVSQMIAGIQTFAEEVYHGGLLEVWAREAARNVEAGGEAISAALHGQMQERFVRTLLTGMAAQPGSMLEALSPEEAARRVAEEGVYLLQDPNRTLSAEEAVRRIQEGSLLAFQNEKTVVWIPATAGRKSAQPMHQKLYDKARAGFTKAEKALNKKREKGEATESDLAEESQFLKKSFDETVVFWDRLQKAGTDVERIELFLTEGVPLLIGLSNAETDNEAIVTAVQDAIRAAAYQIDSDFGQAVSRFVRLLAENDLDSTGDKIYAVFRDMNSRFFLPNGFYVDVVVEAGLEEVTVIPYQLASAPRQIKLLPDKQAYSFYHVRHLRADSAQAVGESIGTVGGVKAYRDAVQETVVVFENEMLREAEEILHQVRGETAFSLFDKGDEEIWAGFVKSVRGLEGASSEDKGFWLSLRDDPEIAELVRQAKLKDFSPQETVDAVAAKNRLATVLHELRHALDELKDLFEALAKKPRKKYIAGEVSANLAEIALGPTP
ncbi:MAG TPA: hypothetical protein P5079_03975, partial [Elusimicrobiota bacterium]|nr:hypothetical protein [Elusimicrobiota bacterium]